MYSLLLLLLYCYYYFVSTKNWRHVIELVNVSSNCVRQCCLNFCTNNTWVGEIRSLWHPLLVMVKRNNIAVFFHLYSAYLKLDQVLLGFSFWSIKLVNWMLTCVWLTRASNGACLIHFVFSTFQWIFKFILFYLTQQKDNEHKFNSKQIFFWKSSEAKLTNPPTLSISHELLYLKWEIPEACF